MVVLAWGLTPVLLAGALAIAPAFITDNLEHLGQTGDLFGVINSLFSGSALAAVEWTLYLQSQDRRRDARPFVVPSIVGDENCIRMPMASDGAVVIPICLDVSLENSSRDAVALNTQVFARIADLAAAKEGLVETPLTVGKSARRSIQLEIKGKHAKVLVDRLCEGADVVLGLEARYDNIDQVRWMCGLTYKLSLIERGRERDVELLRQSVHSSRKEGASSDKSAVSAQATVWAADAIVSVVAVPQPGSWEHRERP
jgi:hypothetical protein